MICLFFTLLAIGSGEIFLSSNEYDIFRTSWSQQISPYENGYIMFLPGDVSTGKGACFYRWDDTGINEMVCTTPREGFFSFNTMTSDRSSGNIFLGYSVTSMIYRVNSNKIHRYVQSSYVESSTRCGDKVFFGSKGEKQTYVWQVNVSSGTNQWIINGLPDHPVESYTNDNLLILGGARKVIAISSTLSKEVFIYDVDSKKKVRVVKIDQPYPGYITPSPKFNLLGGDFEKERIAWLESFDRLIALEWHKGKLFGLFRKGLEGHGKWVSLESDSLFTWNNNKRENKILDLSYDSVIFGIIEEKEDEVNWKLWSSDNLPNM